MQKTKIHLFGFAQSTWLAVLLLAMILFAAGCQATKVIVPPIMEKPSQVRLSGKFVWFDLFSTDMAADAAFYKALFGWEMQATNKPDGIVKTFVYKGKPVANMIGRQGERGQSQWLPYISVDSVDASLEKAESLGGTTHKGVRAMPDRGRVAILLDPQRAAFGMVTSSSGDPADGPPVANTWLGSELWTNDVDKAEAFYANLVGYTVKRVTVHDGVQYRLLRSHGHRRGGIVELPKDEAVPEWIPFIAVDDIRVKAAKVKELGGRLLLAPDMDVKQGLLAIVADPSGAIFGMQQVK